MYETTHSIWAGRRLRPLVTTRRDPPPPPLPSGSAPQFALYASQLRRPLSTHAPCSGRAIAVVAMPPQSAVAFDSTFTASCSFLLFISTIA